MAVDYTRFLAEQVLSERKVITHRLLSRALKVHSHQAKRMLYDFHRSENAKRPGSVHATYVVTGIQTPPDEKPAVNGRHSDNREDEAMQSSPYLSSSMPQQDVLPDTVKTFSILLARQEDLADTKSRFQSISLIYVYSLQPTVLQDLNVLTEVSRGISAAHATDDLLEMGAKWGMIQNTNVKRRTAGRPPARPVPQPTIPASASSTVSTKGPLQKEKPVPATSELENDKETVPRTDVSRSSANPTGLNITLKRGNSNLFSSFAKAKPKLKNEDSTTTLVGSGTESVEPPGAENAMLDDDSDGEQRDLFTGAEKRPSSTSREARKEREEKLRRMMEDDDEEMPDVTELPEEPTNMIDQPTKEPDATQQQVTVQGGRRRGRRQVMKKKTMKDDEGYLVTVEEPVWESFSENEVAPPKKKPAASIPKGKATGGKTGQAGQGSIMSFFSKK